MTPEKKEEIITAYVGWHNMRHREGIALPNPFRYGSFALWLSYRYPDEVSNTDELHKHLLKTVKLEPAGEDYFDGYSFDPWID